MYDLKDDEEIETKQYKVVVLGDGAVGKTSICNRFSTDQFNQTYKQTIGVDFFTKKINLPPKTEVTMQLWDIGGQSIGSKMVEMYVGGAHAVLLCYDITNYDSFANLEDWYRIVTKTFKGKPMPYIALVANKIDLKHLTVVRLEQHNQFAQQNKFASFMMSAKIGDQVMSTMMKVASKLSGVSINAKVCV